MMNKALILATLSSAVLASEPHCRTMKEIYADGKELCEKMYSGAFRYVPTDDPEYDLAYTMWFHTEDNPNDAVSANRIKNDLHTDYNTTEVCHLNYFHKDIPGPEPETFTECHPWQKNACCSHEKDFNPESLNANYGEEYRWDKCGTLTQACERFFVQEGCFYECDVNAGLFRKYSPNGDRTADDYNEWQMHDMPIKGDYCDAWYTACKFDNFCVDETKGFFSCPMKAATEEPTAAPTLAPTLAPTVEEEKKNTAAIVLGVLGGIFFICTCVLFCRERAGSPLFTQLEEPTPTSQSVSEQELAKA